MHRRPTSALIAAAIALSTVAGASAATAAPASGTPEPLSAAAAAARADASSALAGLALPTASSRMRAAASGSTVLPLDSTIRVKVAAKKYDIDVVSTGAKSDRTSIRLYLAGRSEQVSVRRLVRVTVVRHGYQHPLLQTTTTFKRFVVMLTGLESNPLMGTSVHFATRSAFVAALSHGLAISSRDVTKEYGSLLRFVQMALDLSSTLVRAAEYAEANPTATDLSAVHTVQTTKGSGAYTGTVTLTGTIVDGTPQRFSVAVTDTTDATAISETFDDTAITITCTVGGKTYSQSVSLTS